MTIDYADWNTSADHALKAYTQGAALARKPGAGVANTGTTIAPLTEPSIVVSAPWDQPGWEANMIASFPVNAGAKPFARVSWTWKDSTNVLALAQDRRYFTIGNGVANSIITGGYGPAKGDVLTVSVLNLDPAQTLTLAWSVQATSHMYPKDKWRQESYIATGPNNFTNANGDPASLVLMSQQPTLLPTTPQGFLLATWQGSVRIMVDNTAGANAVNVVVTDAVGDISPAPEWLNDTIAAGTRFREDMPFIAKPVIVKLTNTGGAGNISPVITVTAVDD